MVEHETRFFIYGLNATIVVLDVLQDYKKLEWKMTVGYLAYGLLPISKGLSKEWFNNPF